MSVLIDLAESRAVPDLLIRAGIRRLVGQRLTQEAADDPRAREERAQRVLSDLAAGGVALETQAANRQHYDVPPAFFELVLGPRLKYSCALWDDGVRNLEQAELRMLELYAARAGLADGQRVLDLGCGWGSFTLWAAARYPGSRFTAVSNSASQRRHIQIRAQRLGLDNVSVITRDVNDLDLSETFDRIVTVEMLEHVRNYAVLFNRVSGWLAADGKLFVHIFCHRNLLYPFQDEGEADWMSRHFFTGGLMPAADTLLFFQDDLRIERRWNLAGTHYARTARAWLDNLDAHRRAATGVLRAATGDEPAERLVQRWRMFFMACEELFGYRDGSEWMVCHYLFGKRGATS